MDGNRRFRFHSWLPAVPPPFWGRVVQANLTDLFGGTVPAYKPTASLLWGLESEFSHASEALVDFVQEILYLGDLPHWSDQRNGLADLFRRLFQTAGDAPVWITAIPYKPRTNDVLKGWEASDKNETLLQRPGVTTVSRGTGAFTVPRSACVDLRCGLGELSLGSLRFAHDDPDAPLSLQQWVRVRKIQQVSSGRRIVHVAREYPVCLVEPSADAQNIREGWIPAQNRFYDRRLHTLRAPHVTVGKLLRGARGPKVLQFNITLVPETGTIASLMTGVRSIEMFLLQHPLDRQLLENAQLHERYA